MHADLLLITTYVPVLGLVSRSVALIALAHLALSASAPTPCVLALILLLAHIDARVLQSSTFDSAAGYLHPTAMSLVVWIAAVRCSGPRPPGLHWAIGLGVDGIWVLCACLQQGARHRALLGSGVLRLVHVGAALCLLVRCGWVGSDSSEVASALEHMLRASALQALLAALFFAPRGAPPLDDAQRLACQFVLFAHRYAAASGCLLVCAAAWCARRYSVLPFDEKRSPSPDFALTLSHVGNVPGNASAQHVAPNIVMGVPSDEHGMLQAELRRALASS